jgi:hypothetical protein
MKQHHTLTEHSANIRRRRRNAMARRARRQRQAEARVLRRVTLHTWKGVKRRVKRYGLAAVERRISPRFLEAARKLDSERAK